MRTSRRTGNRRKFFWSHWLPVICWFSVIFFMSSQPYEKQDLRPWIKSAMAEQTVEKHFADVQVHYSGKEVSIKSLGSSGFVEFFIRKGAHLMEYMLLGILLFRLLTLLIKTQTVIHILYSLLLCAIYAALDEFHQTFTLHRTPLFADVILDTCGAVLGIMSFYLFKHFRKTEGDRV